MSTNQVSAANTEGEFIRYMALINATQNGIITIDSDSSEDDEVKIVEEMTGTTENHRCDLCNEGEFLVDKLLRFGGLINEKYKFVCDKCDKNFEHKSKLNEHSSKCKGPDFDQTVLANSSQIKSPLTAQSCDFSQLKENDPIMCKICLKFFKSQGGLTKHMNNLHSGVTHSCEVCKATFTNFQKFRNHCSEHQMQYKNYVCTVCGKRFHSSANLKKHERRHKASMVKSTPDLTNQTTKQDT